MLLKQKEITNLDLYILTYIIIEDFTLFQNLDSTYVYLADQIEAYLCHQHRNISFSELSLKNIFENFKT